METANPARLKALATAVLMVAAFVVLGFIGGTIVTTRILTMGGMGWDQLADFLSGAMFGAGGGFVVGLVLAWRLSAKARMLWAALALLAAAGAFAYLLVTPANIRSGPVAAT